MPNGVKVGATPRTSDLLKNLFPMVQIKSIYDQYLDLSRCFRASDYQRPGNAIAEFSLLNHHEPLRNILKITLKNPETF
jgi:hypothetical protein